MPVEEDELWSRYDEAPESHHVQTITGVSADCLAGSWASVASRRPQTFEGNDNLLYLDVGDLREGLRAAGAVGDDRIQEFAGQQVNPHNWTHGSAEQREAWFTVGLDTGDPTRCSDTFDESVDATRIMPG